MQLYWKWWSAFVWREIYWTVLLVWYSLNRWHDLGIHCQLVQFQNTLNHSTFFVHLIFYDTISGHHYDCSRVKMQRKSPRSTKILDTNDGWKLLQNRTPEKIANLLYWPPLKVTNIMCEVISSAQPPICLKEPYVKAIQMQSECRALFRHDCRFQKYFLNQVLWRELRVLGELHENVVYKNKYFCFTAQKSSVLSWDSEL